MTAPRKPSAALRRPRPVSDFSVGDVVLDPDDHCPTTPAIVVEVRGRGIDAVWAHGGRGGGAGLLYSLVHREPRVRVEVTAGMLGNRGWNREQAVRAALRRAGIEVDDYGAEPAPAGREAARHGAR